MTNSCCFTDTIDICTKYTAEVVLLHMYFESFASCNPVYKKCNLFADSYSLLFMNWNTPAQ